MIFTLLIGVLGGRALGQIFNIYQGYGVLQNGWQDNSNFFVNLQNQNPVLENGNSIAVNYSAAGQIVDYSLLSGFTSAYIAAIGIIVYEPTTSGRTVNVSINVNGTQSAAVPLTTYIVGTPAANTWMEVIIPLSAFGITQANPKTIYNIELSNGVAGAQAPFYIGALGWVAWPASILPPVTINVNPSVQLTTPLGARTVDQKMLGVNTAVWNNDFYSATCQDLIGRSDFRAFRFPGGSLSDTYNWLTNQTIGSTYSWPTDFDTFASSALVHNAGGQGFITANYGTGTVNEAAAWVHYSNLTKHYGMKYWEIGNEVYGNWETDTHTKPNDPVTYAQQFALYYAAMKAQDPTIKIGAVAAPGEDSYINYPSEIVTNPVTHQNHSGWTPVMLSTLQGLGVTPDFIIYHRYPEYNIDCDYTLLTGNGGWATDMANMRMMLNDYLTSGATANVQIMCTENNADAGTPGKQLTSLTNALYMADSFGQVLNTECNSYMFWDLLNGQATNPADGAWIYGWRPYGDEGIFSGDFTQLYPTFFAHQLMSLFAGAGDEVVSATSSYGMLTAYATKRSDGTVRVMVINLAPNQSFSANLSFLGGFHPQGTAVQYSYGITQDNEANPNPPAGTPNEWPELAYAQLGGTSTANSYTFPAYSISVILYTPTGQRIGAPPLFVRPRSANPPLRP